MKTRNLKKLDEKQMKNVKGGDGEGTVNKRALDVFIPGTYPED